MGLSRNGQALVKIPKDAFSRHPWSGTWTGWRDNVQSVNGSNVTLSYPHRDCGVSRAGWQVVSAHGFSVWVPREWLVTEKNGPCKCSWPHCPNNNLEILKRATGKPNEV